MAGNEGFEEFAAANLPRLLRFGLLLTGDPHQAEELVQAGLVRTLGAWKRVDQRQNPLGYVQQTMAR
jgi:DNA-directed RNA polymerase specialized sigma24 family protein